MSADLASAKQHLSAAVRHMARATDKCEKGDPLVDVLAKMGDTYLELVALLALSATNQKES